MKLLEKLSYLGVVLPTFSSAWSADDFFDSIVNVRLRVSMYRSWPENDRTIDQWSALSRTLPMGTAFGSPAWQAAIGRAFMRVGRYRLITVQEGQHLRAVLPLQVGLGGVLESPGEMISDYLEPLVQRDTDEDAWRLILGMLRAQSVESGNVPIVLHNVPADGRCRQVITSISKAAGFELSDEETTPAARIALPATWDEYLAKHLDGRERKELKRKIKKATSEMGATMDIVEQHPQLDTEVQRVLAFMVQGGGSKGIKARWTYRPLFRRAAAELCASGQLKVYRLLLKDQVAASVICFPTVNGPLMWAAGFDPQFSKWSPGIVLFGMAIKHSIENGAKYFDLLRGQHRYKGELGASDYPLRKLTLRPTV